MNQWSAAVAANQCPAVDVGRPLLKQRLVLVLQVILVAISLCGWNGASDTCEKLCISSVTPIKR